MKALLMSVLCFGIIGSSAFASELNYSCISERMQAINSDIFYNLSQEEIDTMLSIPEMIGHTEAVLAKKMCAETEETAYQCIAKGLAASNSAYEGVSKEQIKTMLTIPEYAGHIDAVREAKKCGFRYY